MPAPTGRAFFPAQYCTNIRVSVIDTATPKVVKEIPVGELPWSVSIPPK
jgi:YVTN family beta-propeller protein